MSASERGRGAIVSRPDAPASGAVVPPVAPPVVDTTSWLERGPRGRGRHGAITRTLGSIASYRSWADKMKGSFDDEPK